jgi:hypothetical protein
MRVPFGPRVPNEQETGLLTKLGFNLASIEHTGRYYFLNTPDNPRVRCEKHTPDFDKIRYDIYYNEVEVISIRQKTAIYDSYVFFDITASSVEEALAKSAEMAVVAKPELSEYQVRLTDHLQQLVGIIFEGGASRGHGSMIGCQFPYLRELRKENPIEHDALIASNSRYKELLEMFPNWTDPQYLQGRYERMDAGPLAAMSAISEDGTNPCKMM